jgi:hypothetical protein
MAFLNFPRIYTDMIGKSAVASTRTQIPGSPSTINILEPSRDESVPSRSRRKARMANDTTNFVFVNEANHSPQFKALNRRKVRSHARRKKYETGGRTKSTGFRALAPQGRGYGGSQFLTPEKSGALAMTKRRTPADSDGKPLDHRQNLGFFC